MASGLGLVGWLVVVATTLMGGATAETYTVGGSLGWEIPAGGSTVYSTWAANKTFVAEDILVFNWTGTHNVARVSKSDFNSCIASNNIGAIQSTSPANVTLPSNDTYYFICGIGKHCTLGQKVAITVGGNSSSGAPPLTTAAGAFAAVVLAALAVSFIS